MSRIAKRFSTGYRNAPCSIAIPHLDKFAPTLPGLRTKAGEMIVEKAFELAPHANCSMHYIGSLAAGNRDKSGNYSDFTGALQRNESQISFMVVRPDSLQGDPVLVHSGHDFHFDAILFTPRESHPPRQQDVLDVFENLHSPFFSYITISLLLAIIVLATSRLGVRKVLKSKRRNRMRRFLTTINNTISHVVYGAVNQVQMQVSQLSTRCLWTSIVLSLFVSITGFLWNLMSTDQVVEIPVRQIDSLEDLYSDAFKDRPFVITTNLFLYEVLAAAPPSTKLGKLFTRINGTWTINFNIDGGEAVTTATAHNQKHKHTSATWRWLFETAFVRIFCHIDRKEIRRLHISEEKFAPGLMTSMFSRNIDPELREYVSYRLLTRTEMGMATPFVEKVILEGVNGFLFDTDWKAFKCMHGLRNTRGPSIPFLRYSGLRNTLSIVKWCFIVAFAGLVLERIAKLL